MIEELVLPADVRIVAVSGLDKDLRERLACDPDEYAVTRHGARSTSSIVDRLTARLLEQFRSPLTIVDAVIALSRAEGLDPRQTLEDSFNVLNTFITDGMLVPAGSPRADPIRTTLGAGDRVGDLEIVEPVHVVVDTEVYRARTAGGHQVALKIARPGSEQAMAALFAHEASVLAVLDGLVNPRLIEHGEHQDRPYVAVSWHAGVDVLDAAAELRALDDPPALLALVERVLAAFAHLHRQSVVHGDIHPRNILVDAGGTVNVIDFGLSAAPGAPSLLSGGVDLFMPPEVASARLDNVPESTPAPLREQYALAALAYAILTGTHTNDFSLHRDEMLRQLRDEPPVPFARVNAGGFAAVEPAVRRALAKNPGDRFASVDAFLDEFRRSAARPGRPRPMPAGRRLVDRVLARLTVPGELYAGALEAPTASVMNGAAGFAYALLRMAALHDDERLFGLADLWSAAAVWQAGTDEAFFNAELELTPGVIGRRSFYHHEAGAHAVQALVAAARADDAALRSAVDAFVRAADGPCPALDVSFGRAGLLIGCAQLVEAMPAGIDTAVLRSLGDRLCEDIDHELAGEPPIAESSRLTQVGAAHGWAGHLYALLRWTAATGRTPVPALAERLGQLAGLGRMRGRAMRWPIDIKTPVIAGPLSASWCNGSAGFVPLWALADTVYGGHAQLAAASAWGAYEDTHAAGGDICCGLAGRAYALIAMYHHSGETVWLSRARRLAETAAERVLNESFRRDSLYKGEVGVALLVDELSTAEPAGLPLFAPEGWPHRNKEDRT